MSIYAPSRVCRSEFVPVRGLNYHVRVWDPVIPPSGTAVAPTLVMVHGWMDVSASFQFLVDRLGPQWRIIAPDWRGYGLTEWPKADCYWFPDYLGDLDALLEHYSPDAPVRLVGHSMGGNVSMLYAGVRPERVARLVNLEGMGMPRQDPAKAPERYAQWLGELRAGARMRDYASRDEVAQRLRQTNPRLAPEFAAWLAQHWSRPTATGRFELLGDPAHKHVNPDLYRVDEIVACWRRIAAPVLLVVSEHLDDWRGFTRSDEYAERLAAVAALSRATVEGAGHMMHHDQPARVAGLIEDFMA